MALQLLLPRRIRDQMLKQARAELPNECCGVLAARLPTGQPYPPREGQCRIERCYPLINAAASPREFLSDAKSQFEAEKDMRHRGLELIAVYHSHPTSAPIPSKTDRERNYSDATANFIISLQSEPPEVRAWWLTADGFEEAEWKLVEDEN